MCGLLLLLSEVRQKSKLVISLWVQLVIYLRALQYVEVIPRPQHHLTAVRSSWSSQTGKFRMFRSCFFVTSAFALQGRVVNFHFVW